MKNHGIYHAFRHVSCAMLFIGMFCASFAFADSAIVQQWGDPVKNTVDHWGLTFADGKYNVQKAIDGFVREQQLKKALPEKVDYVVGLQHSLAKVFSQKSFFKGMFADRWTLEAAQGECEAFQICILPVTGRPLEQVKVSVSDFTHDAGKGVIPSSQVRCYRAGYVQTRQPTFPTPYVGDWPDPLFPLEPFDMPSDMLQPIWIEVSVPTTAHPGHYTGTVTVTVKGAHDVKVGIDLTVWDFQLPAQTDLVVTADLSTSEIALRYGKENEEAMFDAYCSYMLAHKMQPNNLVSYYWSRYQKTPDRFVALIQKFVDKGLHFSDLATCDPELYRILKEHKWLDMCVTKIQPDEPRVEAFPAMRERANKIAEQFPGLKRYATTHPDPGLNGSIDCWMLSFGTYDLTEALKRREHGEELWWYQCSVPIHSRYNRPYWEYPSSLCVDRPALDHRIQFWMLARYGVRHLYFWSGNMWSRIALDPKKKQYNWTAVNSEWPEKPWIPTDDMSHDFEYGGIFNGDGYVLYPGAHGPIPSLRFKILRDGIEDIQYLDCLAQQMKQVEAGGNHVEPSLLAEAKRLLAIDSNLFVTPCYYNRDPNVMIEYRRTIAKMIVLLKK